MSLLSVHILTSLLRPRRSAARTVPRILVATSLQGHSPLDPLLLQDPFQVLLLTWTLAAAESSAGPGTRQAGLHLRLPQKLWLRAQPRRLTRSAPARRLDRGGRRCRTGCRRGRGGGGQESGSLGAEQAGMHPRRRAARRRLRAAGGGRAEVSLGARRGRRLSMPSPRARGRGRSAAGGSAAPITGARKGLNLRTPLLWAQCGELAAAAQFNCSWDNFPEARGTGRW